MKAKRENSANKAPVYIKIIINIKELTNYIYIYNFQGMHKCWKKKTKIPKENAMFESPI